MEPRQQVLEQALRSVFEAPQTDLSWRVVSRWHAGAPGAARAVPAFGRRLSWCVAAGVAVAVLWMVRPRPGELAALAMADVPVTISDPGQWRPVTATRLAAAQTVVAERPATLTLTGGTRLLLAAGTVLRLSVANMGVGVHLLAGDITLSCTSRSAVVTVGAAQIAASTDTRLQVRARDPDYPYVSDPQTFLASAESLHMNFMAPAVAAAVTLLAGSAVLSDADGSRSLPQGKTVEAPSQKGSDRRRELLAREAGTWDLTITDYRGATPQRSEGTEVCRLPSGGEWLLSDMTTPRANDKPVWAHVVLGYAPGSGRWSGSFVDSFGGQMALLEGDAGDDAKVRVLSLRRFDGKGDFGLRITMRWVSDDERLSVFEIKDGDQWRRVREIAHRRRK